MTGSKWNPSAIAKNMFCNWFFLASFICAYVSAGLAYALHPCSPYAIFTFPEERLMPDFPSWLEPQGSGFFDFLFFLLPFLVIALALTIIWWLGNTIAKQVQSLSLKRLIKWHLVIYACFVCIFSWFSLALFWDDQPLYQYQSEPHHQAIACWLSAIYLHLFAPFVVCAIPTALCAMLVTLWAIITKITTVFTKAD